MKRRLYASLSFLLIAVMGLTFAASCQEVSAQDIQGILQAMEGKEMVITLSDGSTVRVTVDDASARSQAASLVGDRVNVQASSSRGALKAVKVSQQGEDELFTGVIESIGKDSWKIGGRTFKVDAATVLDGGLREGVTARVEAVKLADGSMLATEIETDEEDEERLAGTISSISSTQVVINGKTFQITPATRLDNGLAAGVKARVEFATKPDGTLVALEIETDEAKDRIVGLIESMGTSVWKIGGRDFIVNDATRLDEGLAVGITARVEFTTLSDGKMVATEIETDQDESRSKGVLIESIAGDTWTIGGQKYKVIGSTRLDVGLKQGSKVEVRFIALPDGTKQATRIKEDRSGPGAGTGQQQAAQAPRVMEDQKFEGTVESISADKFVIGGQTFKIDKSTMLDSGLAVGKKVRVEFITLPDGTKLAKEIETDDGKSGKDDKSGNKPEDKPTSTPTTTTEAGDDKGGGGAAEPGDDKGGASGKSG